MSEVSELTLLIMRIGFLLLLWLFIFAIVYALRSDLFGAPVRKLPADAGSGTGSGRAQRSAPTMTPASPAPPAGSLQPSSPPVITPTGGALPSAGGGAEPAATGSGGRARQLVITSGVAAGTVVPLDEDVITIGRSSGSSLVIVDEYTSTYHAKLTRNGDQWTLTDLDSTNGTKLNGNRVTGTALVPPFTPVTIGTTTFELRP